MNRNIDLSDAQRRIMREFYSHSPEKVIFNKRTRNQIWTDYIKTGSIPDYELHKSCPAVLSELRKSISSGNLVQSAVFSECVYAQTLANMISLPMFTQLESEPRGIDDQTLSVLSKLRMKPRYVYGSEDRQRQLVQAGGFGSVDSVLISQDSQVAFLIEFKEPAAKTSEPDLPKYGEDGGLKITPEFVHKNPQFKIMLDEQMTKGLNFFEKAGSNINDFSQESIEFAVSENYMSEKFADVIVTEDRNGFLTMLPANQVSIWARTRGEIRPAGRNKYAPWTPNALRRILAEAGAQINGDWVTIPSGTVKAVAPRGGTGVNRYKLHPLFFVYSRDVELRNDILKFEMRSVKQLNPTISAHMFFDVLDVNDVKEFYSKVMVNG